MLDESAAEKLRQLARNDQFAVRNEFIFKPPSFIQTSSKRILNDERDKPLLYLLINILCITVPSAILLFSLAPRSHLAGILHVALNYALFLQRFMLTLHFTEHRRLFRKNTYFSFSIVQSFFYPYI